MEKFTRLTAIAAPLPLMNVDTDMIIPARFLKTIKRSGLGRAAFYALRYDDAGAERPEFVLNEDKYRSAKILIAHANFGCGSSREHAPWALADFGIRCVIAPSFADIFRNNCTKSGILCVALSQDEVDRLLALAAAGNTAGGVFTVDLESKVVTGPDESVVAFDQDEADRHTLLHGLDDIELTLQHENAITAFEERRRREQPWTVREIAPLTHSS